MSKTANLYTFQLKLFTWTVHELCILWLVATLKGGGASAINETLLYVAVAKYSLEESTQVKESKTHSPSEKR